MQRHQMTPATAGELEDFAKRTEVLGGIAVPLQFERAAIAVRTLEAELEQCRAELNQALATVKANDDHARIGERVAQIYAHPANAGGVIALREAGAHFHYGLGPQSLEGALRYLDNLVPKESEWSDLAPSGNRYRFHEGRWHVKRPTGDGFWLGHVPLVDVAFVARLVAGVKP